MRAATSGVHADIGKRIHDLRLAAGLARQQDLADRLAQEGFSVARRWVTGIENGHWRPSVSALMVLARIFEVSPSYIEMGNHEAGQDSEFIANLKALENRLDADAQRSVLRVAMAMAEESEARASETAQVAELIERLRTSRLSNEARGLLTQIEAATVLR